MAEIDTLLAHLSPSFTSQTENIAVEALGYVLNKYAVSSFRVRCQAHIRADMFWKGNFLAHLAI